MRPKLPGPRTLVAASVGVARSGLVRPYHPGALTRAGWRLLRCGAGPGFGPAAGAAFCPDRPGIVDDEGAITFGQLEERCEAVAAGLAAMASPGGRIALLGRNSAGFYQAMVGASRCGLDVVYLNTGFSAGQIADAVTRQGVRALVLDAEFAGKAPPGTLTVAMTKAGPTSIEQMPARPPVSRAGGPSGRGRHIMLTSGTTGPPKSVSRTGGDITSAIALVSGLPNRARESWLIAAPMFHAWGWLNTLLAMFFTSTIVVTHDPGAERVLALAERERCQMLVAVPTMLRRIMSLPPEVRRRYDTASLRAVTVSGSALSPRLADEFMDEFGDILYSFYGSTEAGYAAVASPADLRAAPGTAGRPLPLVNVKVLDRRGRPVITGERGMIWVSSRDSLAGLAGAGVDLDGPGVDLGGVGGAGVDLGGPGDRGAVSTGDIGWFDEAGRLFVAGRADDMMISGGENVYPDEVERTLEQHPSVLEAAVVGRGDEEYGQILVAHLVLRRGQDVNEEAMRSWCRERLAAFQAPKRFVIHDDLPRNAGGKVIKTALQDAD